MEQISVLGEFAGLIMYRISDQVTSHEIHVTVGHGRVHSISGAGPHLIASLYELLESL